MKGHLLYFWGLGGGHYYEHSTGIGALGEECTCGNRVDVSILDRSRYARLGELAGTRGEMAYGRVDIDSERRILMVEYDSIVFSI